MLPYPKGGLEAKQQRPQPSIRAGGTWGRGREKKIKGEVMPTGPGGVILGLVLFNVGADIYFYMLHLPCYQWVVAMVSWNSAVPGDGRTTSVGRPPATRVDLRIEWTTINQYFYFSVARMTPLKSVGGSAAYDAASSLSCSNAFPRTGCC